MNAYRQLLDATVAHLEALRAQGAKTALVREDTLRALLAPPLQPASPRPATPALRPNPVASPKPVALADPQPTTEETTPAAFASPAKPSAAAVARWSRTAASNSMPKSRPAPELAKPPLPPPLSREAKEAAIAELRPLVLGCVRCPNLVKARKNVVFGVGDIHSPLMFVGEAPGADEDERGEPFVGRAGELLTKIIGAMGLSRSQVFIANILKCRPDTPGQSAGNRKPAPEEMATCIPWLEKQIDIIQPKAMVALGATAIEGLLGKTLIGVTRLRGQWQSYRGIPLMPTYHPAYVLRNQAMSVKREVWEDMLKVMEKLAMPISEKQRGYFLKSNPS